MAEDLAEVWSALRKVELKSDELGYFAEGNFQLSKVQISFSLLLIAKCERKEIDGEKHC